MSDGPPKLTLPPGLAGPTMLRIVAIVQRAQRNGDGSLSLEGAKYIRETITAEFGEAMAELIAAQVVVDLDHRGPI